MEESILQNIITLTSTKNIDQSTVQEAEKSFTNFKNQNQSNLIQILISIAEQHIDQNIFLFAINELVSLSKFFTQLSEIQRGDLQLILFQMLENTKQDFNRKLLCKYICSLAKIEAINISSHLIPNLWVIFRSSNTDLYESAFKILKNLFNENSEKFDVNELSVLFENGLQNSDTRVQVACVKAICSYLKNGNLKKVKPMSKFIPSIIECLHKQFQEDQEKANSILEALNQISDLKLFNDSFELLFSVIWNMNEKSMNASQEFIELSLDTVWSIVKESPKILKKKDSYTSKLLELILNHMSKIDQDIVEEWSQELFDNLDEDPHFENLNFGMKLLDEIFESISNEKIIFIFLEQIGDLFTKSDWRENFTAIMAASQVLFFIERFINFIFSLKQVIEFIEDYQKTEQIVNQAIPFLENENPILRYGVFHLIGLFSESNQFSFNLKNQFKKILLQYLDDPVPKVISHAAAAVTNFLEGIGTANYDYEQMQEKFIRPLFEKLLKLINNSDYLVVKESCITAAASIALSVKFKFHQYFGQFIPILFTTLSTYKGNQHSKLIALTIECLTIISISVDKEIFLSYFKELVSIMISIQNSIVHTQDENKSYVITAWQRIITSYSKDLIAYLPQIVPGLFHLIEDVFLNSKIEESSDENIIELTIGMLQVFIDKLGNKIFVHIEKIVEMMELISQFNDIESIKKGKSNCISGLVACSSDNRGTQQILARQLLKTLHCSYNLKEIEVLAENMNDMIECINKIGNFLTQQEISNLTEIIKNVFLYEKKKQKGNNKNKETNQQERENNTMMEIEEEKDEDYDDVDDDEEEGDGEEVEIDVDEDDDDVETYENLNGVYEETSNLLEALFQTHKEQTLSFADELYTEALQKMFNPTASKKQNKFGLFVIDSMIEFLGYEFFKDKLNFFRSTLQSYVADQIHYVRQPAIYGIGIFAIQTPTEVFFPYLEEILQILRNSYNLPQGMETFKQYGYLRDNIVSSIGKIIKYQSFYQQETLNFWIFNLPLRFDKAEGKLQISLLAEICISSPDVLSEEMINHTISVFSLLLETKMINKSGTKLVNQAFKQLQKLPYVASNLQTIVLNLPQNQKDRLERALLSQD